MKIFMYVMAAIGATGVLFGTARFFARGQPATMTKEYQEATNDYLKVCIQCELVRCAHVVSARMRNNIVKKRNANNPSHHRARTSSPSPVSPPRATPAPARSRARPPPNRRAPSRESRERKKCSRISGRAKAARAFANIERRESAWSPSLEFSLRWAVVVKTLFRGGERKPCILRMLVSICHCTKIFADMRGFLRSVF